MGADVDMQSKVTKSIAENHGLVFSRIHFLMIFRL